MDTLPSFWPGAKEQAIMAGWLATYHDLAYGMCYLFGVKRQSGMSCAEAERHVRFLVDAQLPPFYGEGHPHDPSRTRR
jgi:hypothetical protein